MRLSEMHESSLEFLRCVRCCSKLILDAFRKSEEIEEGMLECKNCNISFPIIGRVPILWDDFSKYLSSRITLGGRMFRYASNEKMKQFIKTSLSNAPRLDDRTALEDRWSKIYQNSKTSKFYSIVKNELKQISRSNAVLEHGCSIGLMAEYLADYHQNVFGIDSSFVAIQLAKNNRKKNLDYFVADSMSSVFGNKKFDLVLALNLLELVEPKDLLKRISTQIRKGFLVMSDPYDFERGKNSVKVSVDEISIRKNLHDLKFSISPNTRKPSFHPWSLKITSRTTLNYKVDLIVAKR